MAKQQSTYTGLGATLVQGAGRLYQTQNKAVGVDLSSGFESMSRNILAAGAKREAQREATEAKAANYLGQMEAMDIGVVPESYRGNVEGALRSIKNEYFDTAMALKNMKPTNPEYLDLRDKLNLLNGSIRKISSTFADMAKNKKEDLEFISNRGYSSGNDQSKVDFLNSVLTGEAEMSIDSSGNVLFNHNGEFKSYENLPNIMPYDAKSFDSILTTLDGASRLNRQLTDSDRTLYKSKLMNIIKSGGRDTAISLGSDDFLIDGGMGLGGEAEYDANPEAYKQKLIDSYMGLFENAANDSYSRYQQKLQQQGGGNKGVKQWELQLQSDANLYSQISDFARSGRSAQPKQIITLANQLSKDGTFSSGYNLTKRLLAQEGEDTSPESIKAKMEEYGINPNSLYKNDDYTKAYPIEPQYLESTLLGLAGLSPRRQSEIRSAFGQTTSAAGDSIFQ